MGISFSPGRLGFGKTPVHQALVKQFPLRTGLIKNNRALQANFKMVTFPSVGSTRGFISDDHSEKPCGFKEVKLMKV